MLRVETGSSQDQHQVVWHGPQESEGVSAGRIFHRLAADFILIGAVEEDLAREHLERLVRLWLADEHPIRGVAGLDLLDRQISSMSRSCL